MSVATKKSRKPSGVLVAVLVIDIVLAVSAGFLVLTAYNNSTMHPIHIYSTCDSISATYGNDKTANFVGSIFTSGTIYVPNHTNLTVTVDKNIGCAVVQWSSSGGGNILSTAVTNESYTFYMGNITGGGSIAAIATTGGTSSP
jgi:hypothetical protein